MVSRSGDGVSIASCAVSVADGAGAEVSDSGDAVPFAGGPVIVVQDALIYLVIVCNTAQESVMNANGSFLFHSVVNQI